MARAGNVATYNGHDKFGRAQTYPPGGATLGGYTTRMVVHERFGILVPQEYPLEFAGPVSACPARIRRQAVCDSPAWRAQCALA